MTNASLQAECEARNSSTGTFFGGGGQEKRRQALKFVYSSKLPLQAIRVSYHPGGELISLWGTSSEACLPGQGGQGVYTPTPSSHWLREAGGCQQGLMGMWAQEARKAHGKHVCPGTDHGQPTTTWWGLKGEGGLQECLEGGEGVGEEKALHVTQGCLCLRHVQFNSHSWGDQEKQMQTDTRFTEQSIICMPTTVINCWLSELKCCT